MEKNEWEDLFFEYFTINSKIKNLKIDDFNLKSHTFFYRELFSDIGEIKIMTVMSKNEAYKVVFDVYFVSEQFDDLFKGFFRIDPQTDLAELIFHNLSKVCTGLNEYMHYVYHSSDVLRKYLVSGILEPGEMIGGSKNQVSEVFDLIKQTYMEIAGYSADELGNCLLRRDLINKYVYNFVKFNPKCEERVRMFLISILSAKYRNNVCFVNNNVNFTNYVILTPKDVIVNDNPIISAYALLEYCKQNNGIVFIKAEINFKGGQEFGKNVG